MHPSPCTSTTAGEWISKLRVFFSTSHLIMAGVNNRTHNLNLFLSIDKIQGFLERVSVGLLSH